jgi:hypothetical protein
MSRLRFLVAAAVLVAGCGSGEGKETTQPEPRPATTAPAPAPATTTVPPSFSGQGSAPYCAAAASLQENFGKLLLSSDVETTRTLYAAAQTAVTGMADNPPPEIKDELAVVVGAYRTLLETLRSVDFSLPRLPPDVIAALNAPAIKASADRLAAYRQSACR